MTPIVGFAPDADMTAPGVLMNCEHLIPYESGMKGAPSPVSALVDTLASACTGAAVVVLLDGTRRIFAGTNTHLYELVGTSWTDRSSATYTGSSDTRWSFAQFGNTTIASNLADAMQSSASGSFAAISGAPKAKIVVSASNNFVIAFNTVDGTYGTSPDRWWCCAQNDQTDWTPAVSTLATTGRLTSVEGPIEAALPLGDYVIAYKKRALFIGSFAGSPVVWQWQVINAGECGICGPEAICDIGGTHFFVSDDNFWLFDGTRPVPIGEGVIRKFFNDDCSPAYRYRVKCNFDKQANIVRINYPSNTSSGECDSAIVYHVLRKQFGRDNRTLEAQLNYVSPGVTIDGLDNYSATIDGLPDIGFDSQFWSSGGRVSAYFNGSHQLVTYSGDTSSSSMTTGDVGDDDLVTTIDRLRVRFQQSPSAATATGFYKMNEGDSLSTGPTSSINDGKFDIRQSGRFHRFTVAMTGNVKISAFDAKPIRLGGR